MKSILTAMMLMWSVMNEEGGGVNKLESLCNSTPNYELCMRVVTSDQRTAGATASSAETVALVMVDAVKAKAEEMIGEIHKLEMSKPAEWRLPLSQCYWYYYAVLHADVPEAEAALQRGVPKFAVDGMADAAVEAQSCQAAFSQNQILDSDVAKINQDVIDLAAVAKSIIKILL